MRLRDTTRFLDPTSVSAGQARQAQLVFQDGITRETIRRRPHSPSQERGRGAQLVDVDGDERIDFLFNHASLIHGHCYPPVTNAITEQANRMGAVSFPSGLEEQLGRELLQRTAIRPARIRFVNSGTEAVMLAIGAARRATGRPKILRFDGCYHGSLLALGPDHDPVRRGTSEVVCAFNDPAEVREALEREGPELACVLLDPYPSRGALAPPHRDFLAVVESLRRRHGVLLVVDEIVSSRLAYQGAASQLGLAPDLVCLGKYIGGGLPIGAVVMRQELAALFASERGPVIAHGGTFNGNPVTMAAGIACLRHLGNDQIGRINALTAALRTELQEVFHRHRSEWTVQHAGSLFHLWPRRPPPNSPGDARDLEARSELARLAYFLLCHGVVLAPTGFGCLATTTQASDVEYLLYAVDRFLAGAASPGPGRRP
jgi:glutamate-1-semialdehyde 2,1-aminomutase